MRSPRQWVAAFAFILATLLAAGGLSACGSSSAEGSGGSGSGGSDSGGMTHIRLAVTPGSPTLQVHLADTLGYFKKHGLDVTVTEGADLPTWAAGLDRQWDVVMTTSGIFVTGASKFDLVAVAGIQMNRKNFLGNPLITNNPSIKGPADLAGKRIGVVTLTGTTPAALSYLVAKAGGDPKSMKLVQVPFASEADQLASGQVDAVVSATPYYSTLLENPKNKALFDVPDMALRDIAPNVEQTAFLLFTSSRTWASKNTAAVKAFQQSLQEGITYMDKNPADAKKQLSAWTGLPLTVIDKAPWPPPTSATVTQEEVEPTLTLYKDRGLIPAGGAPDLNGRFVG